MELKSNHYNHLIKLALKEDLDKNGDITSSAIFTTETGSFALLSKDDGILCGRRIFTDVFKFIDESIKVKFYFKDKDKLQKGDITARVIGNVKNILTAERTALNFIRHLSGIATKTNQFVSLCSGKLKILDTRKTTPGCRILEKYAVLCGGGYNHRIGLYDMIMIKDNHADACGSIRNAVQKVRKKWKKRFKIEVETRNLLEVKEAVDCRVDRIMLDNMSCDLMKESVKIIPKTIETEASGNITLERIKEISKCGVDFASIGELTHTIKAFDFSLNKE